jgi:hypothetical protein
METGTKVTHTPHAVFKLREGVKQLCSMVNNYAGQLGLGHKVTTEDWLDLVVDPVVAQHADLLGALRWFISRSSRGMSEREAAKLVAGFIDVAEAAITEATK